MIHKVQGVNAAKHFKMNLQHPTQNDAQLLSY